MQAANPNILLVEGDEDKRVIALLMDEFVVWGDKRDEWAADIKSFGGIADLLEPGNIEAQGKVVGRRALGIVVDADDQFDYPHVPGVARPAGAAASHGRSRAGAGRPSAAGPAVRAMGHRSLWAHAPVGASAVKRRPGRDGPGCRAAQPSVMPLPFGPMRNWVSAAARRVPEASATPPGGEARIVSWPPAANFGLPRTVSVTVWLVAS